MDFLPGAIRNICVEPKSVNLYVPPIVWKGDVVGHIGENDTFFWLLEGECFLNIDGKPHIMHPGQLAFLPRGKERSYTHASAKFIMYEMAFAASSDGRDLMQILELREGDPVVTVEKREEMSALFESACHKALFKDPLYDVTWCANILSIIKIYLEERKKQAGEDKLLRPALSYMHEHFTEPVRNETLAAIVFMQPTYFVRRFGEMYGMPPQMYLKRLRLYEAMRLLLLTTESIEEIASRLGIQDASYFARVFRQECGIAPTEYRNLFRIKRTDKFFADFTEKTIEKQPGA